MSGPWRWDDLAESTRDSIDMQGVDEDEAPMRRCGCEERPNGWWLCSYHDGWQDSAEDVTTTLEAAEARIDALCDLIRALQTTLDNADEVYLRTAFIQDANLWREVTGR